MIGRCSVQLVLRGSRTIINDKPCSNHLGPTRSGDIRLVRTRLCVLQTTSQLSCPKAASVGFVPVTRNACRILLSVTTWVAVVVEDLEALCVKLDVQCIGDMNSPVGQGELTDDAMDIDL